MFKRLKDFYYGDGFLSGMIRDVVFVLTAVVVFAAVSQIAFGMWTPMVAVESGSMLPHLHRGDIVFIEARDRTNIITYEEGKRIGYKRFGDYGDVILYRKFGRNGDTPVIHRAMYRVEKGEPMWEGGPPAPYAGYITKGDNKRTNRYPDQYIGSRISSGSPIKDEWVIGVARFRLPYAGYVRLILQELLESLAGQSRNRLFQRPGAT